MSESTLEPAFIDGQYGKIFVLLRRPVVREKTTGVLFVPPFAEEMNKTRPMLTMLAHGLAARGISTVLPDLYGTGDSAGEFREGRWDCWQDDIARVAAWTMSQGCVISDLLCVRLGCILASAAVSRLPVSIGRTVFWQPVLDGERFLTQFLRLRVAASMMEDRKETVGGLRQRLRTGESLEVAGYELSPALVAQLDQARLIPALSARLGRVHWMEVVRGPEVVLPTPAQEAIEAARPRVSSIEACAIMGEPYWSATEIVRIPVLVERTIDAFATAT